MTSKAISILFPCARSIQPKFPEILVLNWMARFSPIRKVSKKSPFKANNFSRLNWSNQNGPFHMTISTHSQSQDLPAQYLPCTKWRKIIGPLQDPITWYGINYTGTQMTQWDFQNKGILTSPARLSFVLKVPLRHLRPSVIYSVPCDRRAYCTFYGLLTADLLVLSIHPCTGVCNCFAS